MRRIYFLFCFAFLGLLHLVSCGTENTDKSCGESCNCRQVVENAKPSSNNSQVANPEDRNNEQTSETSTVQTASNIGLFTPRGGAEGIIIQRKAYNTSYNKNTLQPNWVSWVLTAAHTDGHLKYRHFNEDESVPEPRATLDDYSKSRWSRGHMCPAGDNKWDPTARDETFLLTNICPQDEKLNGGTWNQIEMACREWAKHYGEVSVICGPIFESSRHQTIGNNHVAIPDAFFKVVAREENNKTFVICFICPNDNNTGKKDRYVTTLDDVEDATGMTFFTGNINVVETDLNDW